MNSIAFIDTEIDPRSRKILDIGCIREDGSSFHASSVAGFTQFLKGSQFICGHNIIKHDLKYIGEVLKAASVNPASAIDTLYLSPLLFPARPYHALLKDDKLQSEESNNPLNDCIKEIISEHPVELAYSLSLINALFRTKKIHSITHAWVLKNYPEVEPDHVLSYGINLA
jgi:hypothetical protein